MPPQNEPEKTPPGTDADYVSANEANAEPDVTWEYYVTGDNVARTTMARQASYRYLPSLMRLEIRRRGQTEWHQSGSDIDSVRACASRVATEPKPEPGDPVTGNCADHSHISLESPVCVPCLLESVDTLTKEVARLEGVISVAWRSFGREDYDGDTKPVSLWKAIRNEVSTSERLNNAIRDDDMVISNLQRQIRNLVIDQNSGDPSDPGMCIDCGQPITDPDSTGARCDMCKHGPHPFTAAGQAREPVSQRGEPGPLDPSANLQHLLDRVKTLEELFPQLSLVPSDVKAHRREINVLQQHMKAMGVCMTTVNNIVANNISLIDKLDARLDEIALRVQDLRDWRHEQYEDDDA